MSARALRVSRIDDVAMAMEDIFQGDEVEVTDKDGTEVLRLRATADIPRFHKIALQGIEEGSPVRKYGEVIGIAMADIPAGGYVHVHNIESAWTRRDS
jgi:predicted RecA/RadA family phage recombinase